MEIKEHIIVIGAGLFGLSTAIVLAEQGYSVTVIEKELDVLRGASLVNQNRIHYGYHYPRSLNTGREALLGLDSFKAYYGKSIVTNFEKYYAIARSGSQTSVSEFEFFCKELNISITPQYPDQAFLNRDLVDACWRVYEPVFDYHALRTEIITRLVSLRRIKVLRNAVVKKIKTGTTITVTLGNGYALEGSFLVNATYSGLNEILTLAGAVPLRAKYQLLVLPILKALQPVMPCGVTIMDGQFCSLVPRGFTQDEYILSHVARSVVDSHIGDRSPEWNVVDLGYENDIIKEANRFYPILSNMVWRESWITTKMILPNQEVDDARPTLVMKHADNIVSVFSGKVTTCISAANQIKDLL